LSTPHRRSDSRAGSAGTDTVLANPARLGIVIPTLNEADALPGLLDDLAELGELAAGERGGPPGLRVQTVVVDGGSSDHTRELARRAGTQVISSPPGRSIQMNAGAHALMTPWLLFLHADSRMPSGTRRALVAWLRSSAPDEAAYFSFRLDARGIGWRAIELGQRLRERLTGLAYGDQGLLLSRSRFTSLGGIPEIPLMEDVEVVRRLRRSGALKRIDAPLVTSARRYREDGPAFTLARNSALISLYVLGVSPDRLARWYRSRGWSSERQPAPGPST
jgi:rSAM/selenodomain-associated transferase 2